MIKQAQRFYAKFVNGYWFAFDRHTYRNVGQPYGLQRGAVAEAARRNGPQQVAR
jgi:hypothetical protein